MPSFPYPLRFLFASKPDAIGPVLAIVHHVIAGWLADQTGIDRASARCGAVTLIQRFGSALKLNIHFHMLWLDGVAAEAHESHKRVISHDLGLDNRVNRIVLCELGPEALLPAETPWPRTNTLSELAREALILTDQAHSWQHVLELFQMHGPRPQRAVCTGSFELQRGMVANGLGVAIAYSRPHSNYRYDGQALVRRPIADALPMQRTLLVHHQRTLLSNAHRVFLEQTQRWFAGTG